MSQMIKDLQVARNEVENLQDQLNDRVQHILLLLISLVDSEVAEKYEEDLWWWYGEDEDRPFRRGDRHGYFYHYGDYIPVYLDEPHISIPDFDAYERQNSYSVSEKRIPIAYLEMSDEELVEDAWKRISAKQQIRQSAEQAVKDAKASALAKLTTAELQALLKDQ